MQAPTGPQQLKINPKEHDVSKKARVASRKAANREYAEQTARRAAAERATRNIKHRPGPKMSGRR